MIVVVARKGLVKMKVKRFWLAGGRFYNPPDRNAMLQQIQLLSIGIHLNNTIGGKESSE
jgi:hypothetical protein